jgi:hypothetical protein
MIAGQLRIWANHGRIDVGLSNPTVPALAVEFVRACIVSRTSVLVLVPNHDSPESFVNRIDGPSGTMAEAEDLGGLAVGGMLLRRWSWGNAELSVVQCDALTLGTVPVLSSLQAKIVVSCEWDKYGGNNPLYKDDAYRRARLALCCAGERLMVSFSRD